MNLLHGKSLKVLVLFHSLSGETNSIVQELCEGIKDGLDNDTHHVKFIKQPIRTTPPFPFPWKSLFSFFDCMPETIDQKLREKYCIDSRVVDPPLPELRSFSSNEPFDLVILGWQTWFLSPSLPVSLALSNPLYRSVLSNNVPILLVGTHRNMWHRASQTLQGSLSSARIVGLVDFVQPSTFLRSVTSTLAWQLKGKKPPAGGATQSQGAARLAGRRFALQFSNATTTAESTTQVFRAGSPYKPLLAWMESVFFPIKLVFARLMGIFPPGSFGRKVVTILYSPILMAVIIFLAAPTLAIGSVMERIRGSHIAVSMDDVVMLPVNARGEKNATTS